MRKIVIIMSYMFKFVKGFKKSMKIIYVSLWLIYNHFRNSIKAYFLKKLIKKYN